MSDRERVEALAKVLRRHEDVNSDHAMHGYECSCGFGKADGPPPWKRWSRDEFDTHRARAVLDSPAMRDLLAEAKADAEARIARAEALIDSWEHDAPNLIEPVFVGRLREALRRDPAPVRLRANPYRETTTGGRDD